MILRPSRLLGSSALVLALGALGVAGCGDESNGDSSGAGGGAGSSAGGYGGSAAGDELEVHVVAAEGADIDLPGGATLVIPAGSLQEDTTITLRVPDGQDASSRVQMFELGPAGTTFDPPATLRVPYAEVDGEEPLIRALHFSESNPLVDQGSEQSRLQELVATSQDQDADTVDFRVDHFTFFWVFAAVDDYAYLVPHIPARYLLPGDLLFTLTAAPGDLSSWSPGHVGVYTSKSDVCAEAPAALGLIEATPPKVQRSTVNTFKSEGGHVYMGARRPGAAGSEAAEKSLTESERESLVTFLEQQVGEEYSMAFGSGNVGEGQWSCVGLAEAAYDSVDKSLLNPLREGSFATPIEMFWNTHPVDGIEVGVGIEVRIEFAGVVVHPDSPSVGTTLRGGYCSKYPCTGQGDTNDYTMELASALPPGASFTEVSNRRYRLLWTPQPEHANQSFDIEVIMNTSPRVAGVFESVPLGDLVRTSKVTLNVVPCDEQPDPCTALPPEVEPARTVLQDLGVNDCSGRHTAKALNVLLSSGDQEKEPANDHTTISHYWMAAGNFMPATLDQVFGACGPTENGLTLCPPGSMTFEAGAYYVLSSILAGDLPLEAPTDYFQYAFVFDQDGDTTNNYAAPPSYPKDFFDSTDRWYEVLYAPGEGFELKVSDATDGVITSQPSNARVLIKGNLIMLLVPASEFATMEPSYRLTAFRHTGDYGMNPPYDWDGFIEPPVDDGLYRHYPVF